MVTKVRRIVPTSLCLQSLVVYLPDTLSLRKPCNDDKEVGMIIDLCYHPYYIPLFVCFL